MNKTTLDILIPSYRASERHLLAMLNIEKPASLDVRYVIVVDDPCVAVSPRLRERMAIPDITLIRNAENKGAPISRNIALEASAAEWVLFWDDDIVPSPHILFEYAVAMARESSAPGFVGPTYTPAPCNTFTSGVLASDILTFWHLPKGYDLLYWGITANLLLRRTAIGDIRFLPVFPKCGGGEDIDFCLRVAENAGAPLSVIWRAGVSHGWWNDGRRSYIRFMRWAYGDSVLPSLFPRHRYYNFPNAAEFIFLGGCVALASVAAGASVLVEFASIIIGTVSGEVLAEWGKQAVIKGNISPITAIESCLVRSSNDLGRLAAHVKNARLSGFMERFDYFCDGRHVRHERIVATVKFAAFIIVASAVSLI